MKTQLSADVAIHAEFGSSSRIFDELIYCHSSFSIAELAEKLCVDSAVGA